jgi:hypothetical protein
MSQDLNEEGLDAKIQSEGAKASSYVSILISIFSGTVSETTQEFLTVSSRSSKY